MHNIPLAKIETYSKNNTTVYRLLIKHVGTSYLESHDYLCIKKAMAHLLELRKQQYRYQ